MEIRIDASSLEGLCCSTSKSLKELEILFAPWVERGLIWSPKQIPDILRRAKERSVADGKLPYFPSEYAMPLAVLLEIETINAKKNIPIRRDGEYSDEEWRGYNRWRGDYLRRMAPDLYRELCKHRLQDHYWVRKLSESILNDRPISPLEWLSCCKLLPDFDSWKPSVILPHKNPKELARANMEEAICSM
jgi:hypothetical protein